MTKYKGKNLVVNVKRMSEKKVGIPFKYRNKMFIPRNRYGYDLSSCRDCLFKRTKLYQVYGSKVCEFKHRCIESYRKDKNRIYYTHYIQTK